MAFPFTAVTSACEPFRSRKQRMPTCHFGIGLFAVNRVANSFFGVMNRLDILSVEASPKEFVHPHPRESVAGLLTTILYSHAAVPSAIPLSQAGPNTFCTRSFAWSRNRSNWLSVSAPNHSTGGSTTTRDALELGALGQAPDWRIRQLPDLIRIPRLPPQVLSCDDTSFSCRIRGFRIRVRQGHFSTRHTARIMPPRQTAAAENAGARRRLRGQVRADTAGQ